ncbi:MAG: radical SAM protein [Bacteroidales bacterium]|nr:radical SAM protein [Lachnoclostridium sp.]MCM1384285.1 radical SAM protein [Lachnoclostridium sp.]MCM1464785.1 radical SAM protein [Bacteroidales bacterium]
MKYYFKIHTGDKVNAGTSSDITVILFGTKGCTEAKSFRACADGTPFQRNQTDLIEVDFAVDVGYVDQIVLGKDSRSSEKNGWLCDSIEVSRQPFDGGQAQCSLFQINDWLTLPRETKTYMVSEGYPHAVLSPEKREEEVSGGTITVPSNEVYEQKVKSCLSVQVDTGSICATDIITNQEVVLSEDAWKRIYDRYVNNVVMKYAGTALNVSKDTFETISIGPFPTEMVYEMLWSRTIYTFHICVGEIRLRFDVPCGESFVRLREITGGNMIPAAQCRVRTKKAYLFDNVGIALTRKCNASCRMCCFECNMKREETLTEREVHDIIEQAAQIEGINRIGFSGGEAMLYPDLLFSGLAKAKEEGMNTSLTSNGFWGANHTTCRRALNMFKNVGLDSLTISVDQYHLEYVPLQSVIHIIQNNRDFGVPLTLAVGDSLEGQRALEILREMGVTAYITNLVMYPFMPVGRGSDIPDDAIYYMPYENDWKCCNNNHLAVLYDGSVYPCCSQAVYGSLLSMGNIREYSLKELIDKYAGKCIFSTMKRRGLDWFVKIAVEEMGMQLPTRYHSACHLCNVLFSDKDFVDRLSSYIEKEYRQTIYEFFER